jgi:hypothetical protein
MGIVKSFGPFTLSTTLLVAGLGLTWALAVPETLAPLSYAALAGLLTAMLAVALNTFKNARATVTVAQLLHDADTSGSRGARPERKLRLP